MFFKFCRSLLLLSVMGGLVAACATAAQQTQNDDDRCTAHGLKPTTKEHDDCVTRLQSSRDARLQQRHQEMVERPAATPFGR
jgi:uncharacterized protein YecT (DUF1311 family)